MVLAARKDLQILVRGPQGLLWPYNLAIALILVLCWLFFTPSLAAARQLGLSWTAEIFVRNVVLIVIVSGGMQSLLI
jgi:hypothetical protein